MSKTPTNDELTQARLRALESLAKLYSFPTMPRGGGYYGTIFEKLGRVYYGAAQDYGLRPMAFVILSQCAPLAEPMTGISVLTELSVHRMELAKVMCESMLKSMDSDSMDARW